MKNIFLNVLLTLICVAAGILINNFLIKEKTGFVRSGVIVQSYKGMLAANESFQKEIKIVSANLDTMNNRYQYLLNNGDKFKNKQEWKYRLEVTKNEFEKYQQQSNQQLEKRQQDLSEASVSEINKFIQEYGEKNNYKIILGTTNDGSVLYGDKGLDLTEKILEELNKKYEESHAAKE